MQFTFEIENYSIAGRLIEKTKDKAVVLVHGFADSKDCIVVQMLENFFLENNFSTLALDMPGIGDSSGDYYYVSARFEAKVVKKAIESLKAAGYKEIWACGHSLGGTDVAIVASELKLPKAILVNPVVDPSKTYEICEKKGKLKRRIDGDIELFNCITSPQFLKAMPNLLDLSLALKNAVIVQSEFDEYCPEKNAKLLFDLIKDKNKKYLLIKEADHNFTEEEMKKELTEKLKDVFSNA